MISWESGAECEDARGYYYDCLDAECADEVPKTIQMHVSRCRHCREEIKRLGDALGSPSSADSIETSRTTMVNALLEMHFKYAEMPVTCAHVRRFLPSTAAQDIRITIPTPITVHIDQCTKCRNDLMELQSLNLSDVQLQRLTECVETGDGYVLSSSQGHLTDQQVRDFACVDYADLDVACLEHVCKCISCRERALAARRNAAGHLKSESPTCEGVSWEELFDLALPVGFHPLADEYALFPRDTVGHVGHCQSCMRQLATLDEILLNMLLPREGGVVTHFNLGADETATDEGGDEYEEYPIRVEVQGASDVRPAEPVPVVRSGPVRSRNTWMQVAAAVVVLMGVTIFSILPRVGAGFMDKVYEATTSAPVVYVAELSGHNPDVASKEWWIFPPNQALEVEGEDATFYDASEGLIGEKIGDKVEKHWNQPSIVVQGMEASIRSLFQLWPSFVNESALSAPMQQGGLDVYTIESPATDAKKVWEAHVDPVTYRIQKVETHEEDALGGRSDKRTFTFTYHPDLSAAKAELMERYGDLVQF